MPTDLEELFARGKGQGYVTFQDLSLALPSDEMSSQQIEAAIEKLIELGINVVEGVLEEPPIDRAQASERSSRRIELAAAALRHGRVSHACQLLRSALTELEPFTANESGH